MDKGKDEEEVFRPFIASFTLDVVTVCRRFLSDSCIQLGDSLQKAFFVFFFK